ncbi:hypothetical protein DFR70_101613 [Nocardia tenerifensis]|uniref:Uncharacterized protein n=1 Tax=Nocardia tenerifensis TaxID=228006 RepID=A0A318K9G1_9NOCA|nr:hypothetical protein [Nocardia tenerifensis]PXX71191.1 hypothetical protein DFR70_101613 [Nocardia tenerifensis]
MFTASPIVARDYPAARSVIVSAWAVPVLIVGQFAMVAVAPVTLVVVGVLRDARLRALRPWAGLLAVAYAVPLGIWALRPDPARSLSKDMHPVLAGLVVASAVVVAVVHHLLRKRYGPSAPGRGRSETDASPHRRTPPAIDHNDTGQGTLPEQ